jgi:hypothetical protein
MTVLFGSLLSGCLLIPKVLPGACAGLFGLASSPILAGTFQKGCIAATMTFPRCPQPLGLAFFSPSGAIAACSGTPQTYIEIYASGGDGGGGGGSSGSVCERAAGGDGYRIDDDGTRQLQIGWVACGSLLNSTFRYAPSEKVSGGGGGSRSSPYQIAGLAMGPDKHLWIAGSDGILRALLEDTRNQKFERVATPSAKAIAFQRNNVWAALGGARAVQAFSQTGVAAEKLPCAFEPSLVAATGSSVWAAGRGAMLRLDTSTDATELFSLPGDPWDLAIDRSGNAWVSLPEEGQLARAKPGGGLETFPIGKKPSGLALSPQGTLWVTDPAADAIHVVAP